ncbi:MAG: choice-of-anchor J domain-containing protein [Euryarchaeota archaeon]|nr:choice-of-anchor J domain-containing protein [Euryarchaeota archaeon]
MKTKLMKGTITMMIALALMVSSLPGFAAGSETKTLNTAVLSEGFEGGVVPPPAWTVQSATTTTWSLESTFVHTGLYAARVLSSGSKIQNEWLKSPTVDLTTPGLPSATLTFWVRGEKPTIGGNGHVKLYIDKAGDGFQETEVVWDLANEGPLWDMSTWYLKTIDLTSYLGSSVNLAWRYQESAVNDLTTFRLDDITISVPQITPKTTIAIKQIGYGSGVSAEIKNTGNLTAENIEWKITVKGGMQGKINVVSNGTIAKLKRNGDDHQDAATVTSGSFFGFGMVDITVTASTNDASPKEVSRSAKGFVILSKCYPMIRLFGNQSYFA